MALLSKKLPREDAHSEKLLAVASYWRKCAALSSEPWRSEMMRDTAGEFEKAAAKATHQTAQKLFTDQTPMIRRNKARFSLDS
jgi:hypothetical protein